MMPVQTLYVTGIPVDVDKEDLKIIFSPYGNVLYTFCAVPRDPSAKTCFGFVEFSTVKEAEYAMQEMNDKPPYKFHISFAKYTRSNKDKRKQNLLSEGTNIRITAFGDRREITLFNQYSDRDKHVYEDNAVNYSEYNGMEYKMEKINCNATVSRPYLVNDKYARNWVCNRGDGLLPTPPAYTRLGRMPFEVNCSHHECTHHSCCSHCMHCDFSSMHGINPTCNNNMYSLNDKILGTDRRGNVLQTKYQKEAPFNQNISTYAERNLHPHNNISDLHGLDFKSRNDFRRFHPENRSFNRCSNEEKFATKNDQKEVFKQIDNRNDNNIFLIQKKLKYQDRKPPTEKNNFNNRNQQDEKRQDYKFKRQQENEDNRYNNRKQTIPFKTKENKQTVPDQKKNNSQKLDWNMREKESLSEYIEPSLMNKNKQLYENVHVDFDKFENFDIGSIITVSVCFGYSPDELWIHKFPDADDNLKELTKDLQIYCEQTKSYSPQTGEICGALFSVDSIWYRARIDNIYGNGLCMAYFVDYGNSEMIPIGNIRQLKSEYLKLPHQAIPCKLAFVKPAANTWSDEATKIILSADTLVAKFIKKLKNKYEIDLIYRNGNSISDLLIKHNYARQVKDVYLNKASNNCMDSQSTENIHKKNNLPIENRQNDFDFSSITEKINKLSTNEKNKNERLISSAIECFKPGMLLKLQIVYCSTTKDFWVRPVTPEANDVYKKLEKLNENSSKYSKYSPIESDVVIAQSVADERWYRAYVINKSDSGYNVRFIDYGNEENIHETVQISSDELCLPSYALHCITDHEYLQKFIIEGSLINVKVTSCDNEKIHMDFECSENEKVHLIGYPWYHNLEAKRSTTDICLISLNENVPDSEFYVSSGIKNLKPGISLKLQIVFYSTEKNFWVQPLIPEAIETFQKLQNLNASKHNKYTPCKLGEIVVAQSVADGCWYRAYFIEKSKNGYKVRFVDYGNEEIINEILHILPEEVCLPSYALHCIIEQEVHLQKFIYGNNLIDVKVKSCDNEKIYMNFENENITVIGYPWYHDLRTSQNNLVPEISIKSNNERKQSVTSEVIVPPNVLNENVSDSEFFVSSGIENFKPGISLKLQIVFCSTDKNFWVQPLILEATKVFQKLQNLNESKHNKYIPCKLGEVVIAQSVADGCWYRAYIIEKSKNGYKVRFVDYGNEEIINEILHILPDEICLPSYALHCIIEQEVDLQKFIYESNIIDVKVISCDSEKIYMNFEYSENEIISIIGYPWYHDLKICQNSLISEISIKSNNESRRSICDDVIETKDIRNNNNTTDSLIPTENVTLNQSINLIETINERVDLSQKKTFTDAMKLKPENMIEEIVPSILKIMHPGEEISLAIVIPFPDKFEFWALISVPEVIRTLCEMQNSLINIPLNNNNNRPSVGDVIAAQSIVDQEWYRAYVLNVNCNFIKVRYIDYGNEEEITDFKVLPFDQANVISAAVYCSIENISEIVDQTELKEQLFNSDSLSAKVNKVQSDTMYLSISTKNNSIINIKALPWYHDLTSLQSISAMVPYEDRQMENLQNISACSNNNVFLYKDCKFVEFPISEIEILITNIVNPETIYCQLADIDKFSALLNLNERITSFCMENIFDNYHPSCGEMCLAKFSDDDLWYRAVPLEHIGDKVQVLFVDFGNIDIVKFEDTRQILPEFMELPVQAVHCMLSEIKSHNWNNEIFSLLKLLPQGEIHKVKVLKKIHTHDNTVYILDIPYINEHLLKSDMDKLSNQPKEN